MCSITPEADKSLLVNKGWRQVVPQQSKPARDRGPQSSGIWSGQEGGDCLDAEGIIRAPRSDFLFYPRFSSSSSFSASALLAKDAPELSSFSSTARASVARPARCSATATWY